MMMLWLAGCTVADVEMDFDSDGDGLMDSLEAELGTDPLAVDSDGDSHTDAVEVDVGSDPTDANDHPYAGGWSIDRECRDQITSTGNAVGDITSDFTLSDQHGEDVSLYDFCGRAVLLVSGAFW